MPRGGCEPQAGHGGAADLFRKQGKALPQAVGLVAECISPLQVRAVHTLGILGSILSLAHFDLNEHRTSVHLFVTAAWCTFKTSG